MEDRLHILKLEKAITNIQRAFENFEKGEYRLARGDLDYAIENIQESQYASMSFEEIFKINKIN